MALEIILGDSPTDEGGLLLQPSPLNRVDSEFTRLIKAAFNDMVTLVGVPIVFGSTTKQCIAGAIKLETIVEPVGRVNDSSIQVTMLAQDFDEFDVIPSLTKCAIDGEIMIVTSIQRDPQDPCVEFRAIGQS